MKNIKLFTILALVISAFVLNGCYTESNDDPAVDPNVETYDAGKIPGLGNITGDLTGTPLTLPNGIELTEDITGGVSQYDYWSSNSSTNYYYGSGVGYVSLRIPLSNTNSASKAVTLPAASIFVSKSGTCQNGVLLKEVTITIPAKSTFLLCLSLYCGNHSKHAAYISDIYTFGVISNANLLLDLCKLIKNKKINIEKFSRTNSNDLDIYSSQVNNLQGILWRITDGGGITTNDIDYINSLPNN